MDSRTRSSPRIAWTRSSVGCSPAQRSRSSSFARMPRVTEVPTDATATFARPTKEWDCRSSPNSASRGRVRRLRASCELRAGEFSAPARYVDAEEVEEIVREHQAREAPTSVKQGSKGQTEGERV